MRTTRTTTQKAKAKNPKAKDPKPKAAAKPNGRVTSWIFGRERPSVRNAAERRKIEKFAENYLPAVKRMHPTWSAERQRKAALELATRQANPAGGRTLLSAKPAKPSAKKAPRKAANPSRAGRSARTPKKNPDALAAFAHLAGGVLSAVQINEIMKSRKAKAKGKRKKANPTGGRTLLSAKPSQTAARSPRKAAVKNPKPRTQSRAGRSARTPNPRKTVRVPAKGDYYLLTIGQGDDIMAVYIQDGDGDGTIARKFKTVAAAKAYATRNRLKLQNPANPRKLTAAAARKIENGIMTKVQSPKAGTRANPRSSIAKKAAKAKNPKPKNQSRAGRSARTPNPATAARRRTFEMFQGRRATKATPMRASHLAPKAADQLGDLYEVKIAGGPTMKFNGGPKLCASRGRLWIVGKQFASPDPRQPRHVINPIGEIDRVVYATYKPHHGDPPGQLYIHKLGEWSGKRPVLCVDNRGYPVIKGGNYTIEARGIVD